MKMIDLSNKLRPTSLETFVGQSHIISKNKALYKLIKQKDIPHLFFYGKPGTGKTTVITEIIQQILKRNKLAKILVTSQSNQAVDNVLEKICENENKIVRFGNDKSKFSNTALKYHEESVFYSYLQEIKKRLESDNTNYPDSYPIQLQYDWL